MVPSILALASLSLPLLSGAASPQEATRDPRIARVEARLSSGFDLEGVEPEGWSLAERMAHYNVHGLSVAVFENGEVVWAKGYGVADVESGRAVTPTTLFQAASISKPVGALAALSLVDEGQVALDAPVNDVLTSWKIPAHAWSAEHPVTLRHLLTHTAGLSVHGFPGYGPDVDVPSTAGVVSGLGNTGAVVVDTQPGSGWRYSGGGYTIAQLAVEDVTGKDYATVLEERVLAPLGMTLSTYAQPLPAARHGNAATAYDEDGQPVAGRFHTYPEQAAAGLWTTPTDLTRYLIAAQRALAGEEHPVVSPATARAMLTPGTANWGLGPAFTPSGARFGHGGANMGFRCDMTAFTDGSGGAVAMTNSDAGSELMRELFFAIAREFDWSEPHVERATAVELESSEVDALIGTYRNAAGEVLLYFEDDAIWFVLLSDEESEPRRVVPTSTARLVTLEGQVIDVRWTDDGTPAALLLGRREYVRAD